MIKQYSLMLLQTAVQCALSLDDTIPNKLNALNGKVLEIIILPMDLNIFIQVDQGTLLFFASAPASPDTVIASSPLGLMRLSLLPASKVRSLLNDKIKISGDLTVGMEIKKIFDSLDVDWETHLARFTGDVIAHQIGLFVRQGAEKTKHLADSLSNNISEYVHEEARLLPGADEVQDFFNEVDELSLYTERLSAYIQPLWVQHEAC